MKSVLLLPINNRRHLVSGTVTFIIAAVQLSAADYARPGCSDRSPPVLGDPRWRLSLCRLLHCLKKERFHVAANTRNTVWISSILSMQCTNDVGTTDWRRSAAIFWSVDWQRIFVSRKIADADWRGSYSLMNILFVVLLLFRNYELWIVWAKQITSGYMLVNEYYVLVPSVNIEQVIHK